MLNFYQTIDKQLRKKPELQLIEWGKIYKAGEIRDLVYSYQTAIQKKSIKSQNIAIVISPSVETIAAILACMASANTALVPPAISLPGLIRLFKKHRVKAVITKKIPPFYIRWFLKLLAIKIIFPDDAIQHSSSSRISPVEGNETALLSFSSGSTGEPKPIHRSHQVLLAQHQVLKACFPPWEGQLDFPLFPNVVLHNLCVGTPTLLPEIESLKLKNLAADKIIAQLQKKQVQSMTGNVFYYTALLDYMELEDIYLDTVLALGVGGSPVSSIVLSRLHDHFPKANIYAIYGSTEAEPIAIRKFDGSSSNPIEGFELGKAIDQIEVKIEPEFELLIAEKRIYTGYIQVKGKHVVGDRDQWLNTGDIGYLTDDNRLMLTARSGNQQAVANMQHFQLENYLLHQQGIKQVAVKTNRDSFSIYYAGELEPQELRNHLHNIFPKIVFNTINKMTNLPLDKRHLSKNIYSKLS